jgi:AmmeMemoRadiSam system protein B
MNKVRNASFSGSWYPGTAKEIHQQMRIWDNKLESFNTIGISGIVPHAGWFFSGSMAYDVIRRIDRETDIVVISRRLPLFSITAKIR